MTHFIPLPTPAITIICPKCKTPGAHLVGLPIPNTDDYADCAQCTACQHIWGLDPGADGSCTLCGGGGTIGTNPRTWRTCPCSETYDQTEAQLYQLFGSDIHAGEPSAYTGNPHEALKALSAHWSPAPTRWQRVTRRVRRTLHLAA